MLTWEIELNKFFRTQSVPLSRRDYNAYDYRTETLGRERNYRSFNEFIIIVYIPRTSKTL